MSTSETIEFDVAAGEYTGGAPVVSANTDDAANAVAVEVVDDTPAEDRGRKPLAQEVPDPTDVEVEAYSEEVQKRIKALTHARHDERRSKEQALRENAEYEALLRGLREENQRLKQYAGTSGMAIATTSLEKARAALKAAQESFDSEAIVKAQEDIIDAKMQQRAAASQQEALQQQPSVVQTEQRRPESAQIDERTQQWVAENKWYGATGYEEVSGFALGLHHKLIAEGVPLGSDEYFAQVDAQVRKRFPEVFGDAKQTSSAQPSKKPQPVVASAARQSNTRKVQLTRTQIAIAEKFGLTPQQYALELLKMERNNE